MSEATHHEVLIVDAGLSGIDAAVHISKAFPKKSYAVLEQRGELGGTWSLFKYPGIRSDSDMYTLGFGFRPWNGKHAIGDGADILRYLKETAEEYGVDEHIRYHRREAARRGRQGPVATQAELVLRQEVPRSSKLDDGVVEFSA